ncbi:MAG: selenite/tellurite reduction operon b-type cytochrome iron-sulfur cluster-binding subunit ExtO [Desulfuromonadales bacterium]
MTMLVLLAPAAGSWAEECGGCHAVAVRGAHADLDCAACHPSGRAGGGAAACMNCHPGMQGVLQGPMASRASERQFVQAAFGRHDSRFFEKNCNGCHVADCLDCHGADGHDIARPQKEDCHACHRGYFVGADYWGLAPREDHRRYQRGAGYGGENYLKMRPDVHAEAGMLCGDCHGMASLAGKAAPPQCRDCHTPDPQIIEHGIAAHLEKLECYACHAAWGAQEYGTFFLRMGDNPIADVYPMRRQAGSDYVRSAYLKRQDAPPLGRNAAGRVSPIRPQFVAYYSDLRGAPAKENLLAAAQWKAYFPHTVRRGTVTCEGCHDQPRRFLLEPEHTRIYLPEKDGMTLPSFWDSRGQTLVNGAFFTPEEFLRLQNRGPAYVRGYVEKWKNFVERVEDSSRP